MPSSPPGVACQPLPKSTTSTALSRSLERGVKEKALLVSWSNTAIRREVALKRLREEQEQDAVLTLDIMIHKQLDEDDITMDRIRSWTQEFRLQRRFEFTAEALKRARKSLQSCYEFSQTEESRSWEAAYRQASKKNDALQQERNSLLSKQEDTIKERVARSTAFMRTSGEILVENHRNATDELRREVASARAKMTTCEVKTAADEDEILALRESNRLTDDKARRLEQRIRDIELEHGEAEREAARLRNDNATLELKLSDLWNDFVDVRDNMTGAQTDLASVRNNRAELSKKTDSIQQQLNEKITELSIMQSTNDNLEKANEASQAELDATRADLVSAHESRDELSKKIDTIQQQLNEKTSGLTSCVARVEQLKSELCIMQSTNEELEKAKEASQIDQKSAAHQIEIIAADKLKIQENAQQKIAILSSEKIALEGRLSSVQRALDDTTKDRDDLAQKVSSLEADTRAYVSANGDLQSGREEVDQLLGHAKDDIEELQRQVHEQNLAYESLQSLKANVERTLGTRETELKSASVTCDDNKTRLKAVSATLAKKESALEDADRTKKALEKLIETHASEKAQNDGELEHMRERLSDTKKKLDKATHNLFDRRCKAQKQVEQLEEQVEQLEERISDTEAELDSASGEVERLRVQVQQLEQHNSEIDAELDSASGEVERLTVQVQQLEQHNSETDAELDSASRKTEELAVLQVDIQNTFDAIRERIQTTEPSSDLTSQSQLVWLQNFGYDVENFFISLKDFISSQRTAMEALHTNDMWTSINLDVDVPDCQPNSIFWVSSRWSVLANQAAALLTDANSDRDRLQLSVEKAVRSTDNLNAELKATKAALSRMEDALNASVTSGNLIQQEVRRLEERVLVYKGKYSKQVVATAAERSEYRKACAIIDNFIRATGDPTLRQDVDEWLL